MYYLSVLSIFKNETMNLKIWIEHYLWQGVEHFYLIDNGSDDDPLTILKEYIDNGIVSYYYLPEKYKQVDHYRYIFDTENIRNRTKIVKELISQLGFTNMFDTAEIKSDIFTVNLNNVIQNNYLFKEFTSCRTLFDLSKIEF